MSLYKFYYFDGRGRGESTRRLFAYADVKYDDVRICQSDWPAMKPKMPFGCVPVLEVDGQMVAESGSINRFLARRFKLDGGDEMSVCIVDMITEGLYSIVSSLPIFEKNPAEQAKLLTTALDKKVNPILSRLEEILGEKDFFVGQISLADIVFLYATQILTKIADKALENFPKLKALLCRVEEQPNIAKWLKNRPSSLF